MRLKMFRHLLIPVLALVALAAWPRAAEAQRRGPVRPRVVFRGGLYGPVYVNPWYSYGSPWYRYGYASQFGYPGDLYGPYGYYGRYDELNSSVRLEVTPRTAEVFVDGYRAGTVDDYDGIFQRLRLRPGEHEITLYLDGYRSLHERVYLNTAADQKVRHTMVPLPAGEAQEPRPEPPAIEPAEHMAPNEPRNEPNENNPNDLSVESPPVRRPGVPGGPGRGGPGRGGPPPRPLPANPANAFGSVSIRVQPADAEVLIDGERWTGPATQERLVVELSRGRHRVEIRKEGYEMYSNDVDVRAGETATLNISLPRR